MYGVLFKGKRYDCGSKIGFLKATVDFALKHNGVKKDFKKYLKDISSRFYFDFLYLIVKILKA